MKTRSIVVPALAALLPAALIGAAAAPASAASHYRVTIHANHKSIDLGQRVQLHGRVTGGPVKHRSVTLFWTRYSEDDTWHRIGTARLNAHGYYSRAFKPRVGGDVAFLVRKSASAGHGRAAATTSYTKVFQWGTVAAYWNNGLDDEPGSNGATTSFGTTSADGATYPHALLLNDGATAGFASYQCKGVRGTVRIPTSSDANAGGIDLAQDDTTSLVSYFAQKGAPKHFTYALDPNAPLAITGSAGGSGGIANQVAVTGLQVLCDAPAN